MIFVKQEICDGVNISIEITSDNVYVNCLGCGQEFHVDLVSELGDDDADSLCADCIKKSRKSNFNMPITLDGLTWLTGIQRNAGYDEQIKDLYNEFEIGSLRNLTKQQYKAFGNKLADMACGDIDG